MCKILVEWPIDTHIMSAGLPITKISLIFLSYSLYSIELAFDCASKVGVSTKKKKKLIMGLAQISAYILTNRYSYKTMRKSIQKGEGLPIL